VSEAPVPARNKFLFFLGFISYKLHLFLPGPPKVPLRMITLRPLRETDIPLIRSWPPYPAEFSELDYCLRAGGWIDEYRNKPRSTILVAMDAGEIAGFSILSGDGRGSAEFRIALHPSRIGNGSGKTILHRTLEYCFADMTIRSVRLIVRKNNLRALALYAANNFQATGECIEEIMGKPVEFFRMEIDRRTFFLETRT
jgi:diamine N-acetyltransferase